MLGWCLSHGGLCEGFARSTVDPCGVLQLARWSQAARGPPDRMALSALPAHTAPQLSQECMAHLQPQVGCPWPLKPLKICTECIALCARHGPQGLCQAVCPQLSIRGYLTCNLCLLEVEGSTVNLGNACAPSMCPSCQLAQTQTSCVGCRLTDGGLPFPCPLRGRQRRPRHLRTCPSKTGRGSRITHPAGAQRFCALHLNESHGEKHGW